MLELHSIFRIPGSSPSPPRGIRGQAAHGKWSAISNFLDSDAGITAMRHCLLYEHNGDSLLHTVCRHRPPLDIVRRIVKSSPGRLLIIVNNEGRTALHVACASGASVDVIKYLTQGWKGGASMNDEEERTPLMLLLANAGQSKEKPHGVPSLRRRRRRRWRRKANPLVSRDLATIVRILLDASPSSVTWQDCHGKKAKDYAMEADLSASVLKLLGTPPPSTDSVLE